jgi:hypothetical protein
MPNQNDALEIERPEQRREIIGVGIKVVPLPGLARSAVATKVMGNTPETT